MGELLIHLLDDLMFVLVLGLEEEDEVADLHLELWRETAPAFGLSVGLHDAGEDLGEDDVLAGPVVS